MPYYSNTDLVSLRKARIYLDTLSDDNLRNYELRDQLSDNLIEITALFTDIIQSSDSKKYYKLFQHYNDFLASGTPSFHMVLGYAKKDLREILDDYEETFIKTQKQILFEKQILAMTGNEFHQYLQFIGIIK